MNSNIQGRNKKRFDDMFIPKGKDQLKRLLV